MSKTTDRLFLRSHRLAHERLSDCYSKMASVLELERTHPHPRLSLEAYPIMQAFTLAFNHNLDCFEARHNHAPCILVEESQHRALDLQSPNALAEQLKREHGVHVLLSKHHEQLRQIFYFNGSSAHLGWSLFDKGSDVVDTLQELLAQAERANQKALTVFEGYRKERSRDLE